MREYLGFTELLNNVDALPNVGWIFIDKCVDRTAREDLNAARFYVAESELEEIKLEDSKRTFLECPTFMDIKSVADKRIQQQGAREYLEAVLYYLEYDDFQD